MSSFPNTGAGNPLIDRRVQFQEIINKGIDTFLPMQEPIFYDILKGMPTGDMSGFGRDMIIRKLYQGGLSGVIEGAQARNQFGLIGDTETGGLIDTNNNIRTRGTSQYTFPSAVGQSENTTYGLAIPMRGLTGNIRFNMAEVLAEQNPSFVGQIIAPKLAGWARNISRMLAFYLIASQNDNYRLCAIANRGTIAQIGSSNTWAATMETDNKTVRRLAPGMQVDVYQPSPLLRRNDQQLALANQTPLTRLNVVVSQVDYVTGTFRLIGSQAALANVANGDFIVFANTMNANITGTNASLPFMGIAGINSFMKFGGTGFNANRDQLLGAEAVNDGGPFGGIINVNSYPQFKSLRYTNVGVLTEAKLTAYLDKFNEAHDQWGWELDTFIASRGVWRSYANQQVNSFTRERTGQTQNLNSEGIRPGFTFEHEGKTYRGLTSYWVENNTVYGHKFQGNFVRYSPAALMSSQIAPGADPTAGFELVAPLLTGTGSDRINVTRGVNGGDNLITDAWEHPAILRTQFVPDRQPVGMRLEGVDEYRIEPVAG
jgi:hypothetical protein